MNRQRLFVVGVIEVAGVIASKRRTVRTVALVKRRFLYDLPAAFESGLWQKLLLGWFLDFGIMTLK